MDNLKIDATKYTLRVDLDQDNGLLELEGNSYPENPFDFFRPVIKWIEDYLSTNPASLQVSLTLNYLNTSSTKCILDILDLLDRFYTSGGDIEVQWCYEEDDDDMLELCEELMGNVGLPIKYHTIPAE